MERTFPQSECCEASELEWIFSNADEPEERENLPPERPKVGNLLP